jgi:LacI family gluconate utilization system Gnt-I transcriptional repressor
LRRDGFTREWEQLGGVTPTESSVRVPVRFGHGRAAFRQLRALDPLPDVVICGSDWLAQGVILEAVHAGLRIPDDLAVFGFGNLTIAGEMRPTISTVDIDGARIGRQTVGLLKQHEDLAETAGKIIDVGFRIVARESA